MRVHRASAVPPNVDSWLRNSRGLTTLEWLLIVAAVAGLAALAVVLVQNVVDETAEDISGNNARVTAAKVAAARISSDAADEVISQAGDSNDDTKADKEVTGNDLDQINAEYKSKCDRLNITYSDVSLSAKWAPTLSALAASADIETWRSTNSESCMVS